MSTPQPTTESLGNYDLIKRFKLDFADITVSKWKSRVTGLSVVHLDYDAPIVKGYFVVPTEIFNDSGCPHTLEHLVFMGSEKYPHKGVLDMLANRGFSNGTNAWTDTDNTTYTISTAGEQGFLQLLPIYLDHILYPTITDAGFVTEVHHINAKGENSGVVYSEMQGRQNTSGDLMSNVLQRLVNPEGNAYRSETGGLMEALRVLTAEQIREYHAKYYVPHNLTLLVGGKFAKGTQSLLEVVQNQVEPSLVAHGQNQGPRPTGWVRPFLETASAKREPLAKTIKQVIDFPEKDESAGEVLINFLGPAPNQFLERKALDVLSTYLTSSSTAPLNKEYIETESPLCTYIYFGEEPRATFVNLPVYIGSVPTEHLEGFDEKLKASLRRIVNEGIDMTRMKMIIDRDERQLRSKLESSKGDTYSNTIIADILYGKEDGSELYGSLDDINHYQKLRGWSSQEWTQLLSKYYIDPSSAVVQGNPSAPLAEKLEKDEKARIAEQVNRLGPDGLKKAGEVLEAAKAEHDKPVPKEVLTSLPLPSVDNISWLPVQSVQEAGMGRQGAHKTPLPDSQVLSKHISADGSTLPFFVQYDHVESSFVTIQAILNLDTLPNELRPHLSAYLYAFFSLPVQRQSGELLSYEAVVDQLDHETESYDVNFGIGGAFGETFRVSIKVELAQYETAVSWLRDLLYGSKFDKDRLQVVIAKIQQSLPEMKRDGNNVMSSLLGTVLYQDNSTHRAGGILPQVEFIPKLAAQLQEHPEEVIADFESIRSHVTKPSGVRFSVSGNVLKLEKPRSTWAKYFASALPSAPLAPVPLLADTLSKIGKKPAKKAIVMSLPTIESSYVTHTTKGIKGFDHPEYPVLRLAVEVLSATESYLWRNIRGAGLAYGAYIALDVEAGFINFSLYRSSNSLSAFEEAVSVLKGLVAGSIEFDETTLDAAKSSLVYNVTRDVSTAERAASASFTNQALKGLPKDRHIELLKRFRGVSKQGVLAAMEKYILPLFDASSSVAVTVTAPSKVDQIVKGMAGLGFDVEKRELEIDPEELLDGSSESEDESDSESESRV